MLKEALTAISGALSQTLGVNHHLLSMRRIKNGRRDRERTSNHHLDFHPCVAFPLCLSTGISWMVSLGICEEECPPSLQMPSMGVQDCHFYFHDLCSGSHSLFIFQKLLRSFVLLIDSLLFSALFEFISIIFLVFSEKRKRKACDPSTTFFFF